jgi:2'-5' RNA ligase
VREPKDIRLFFALWPGSGLRDRLHAATDTIPLATSAHRVPCANLHLTLHFIGNVYFEDMACMQAQAAQVDAEAFELVIDRQGYFAKPRVGWLGCQKVPAALDELQEKLGAQLKCCGYQAETRPYHPHVTVARKTTYIDSEASFAALIWQVSEFALIEVQAVSNGVQYRVVETWPLR